MHFSRPQLVLAARLVVSALLLWVLVTKIGANWSEAIPDPTTGTLGVEAEFDNTDGDLLPGYFVRVRALLGEREVLMVPDIAVMTDQTGRFVFVVDANGVAQRRDVVVGPVVERQRAIESGLTATDDVVVNGIIRVRPGAPVVAKTAAGDAR